MNQKINQKYGLVTAITMIIGVCVGSGIFFKSDNILIATNGSIGLGVLVFALAAIAIIFGSLTFGELASRSTEIGGLITYAETFLSKKIACGFGWFQVFVYYPTISAVISWVVGIYIDILFHLQASLELQILMGFAFLIVCYLYNMFLPKLGTLIQDSSTFIKMIPLFLLGILGIVFGDPLGGLKDMNSQVLFNGTWLAALGPIAYSYDGWIVSTSIANEVKDSKKTMPKALAIAPLVILLIYVLYFVGISSFIGPQEVMRLGDEHVSVAASLLLGETFAKTITLFVVISVMGTLNGLVTGYIRIPYSLALRQGMFFKPDYFKEVNEKYDIPIHSGIISLFITCFWIFIHYVCTKYNLLPNSDVSEIAITVAYLLYIALYVKVILLYKTKEIQSIFKGIVCPIFAIIGSLIILSGAIQNKLFIFYLLFCIFIFVLSQVFYSKHK